MRLHRTIKRSLKSVALLLALAPAISHATLYGLGVEDAVGKPAQNPVSLYTIDKATGIPTLIGSTGFALRGLAVNPLSGRLYAVGATNATNNEADGLYEIDPTTGQATSIGGTFHAAALSFGPDGTLYARAGNNADGANPPLIPYALYTVDLATGDATLFTDDFERTDDGGIAVTADGRSITYIEQNVGVYSIDTATAEVTNPSNYHPRGDADGDHLGRIAYDVAGTLYLVKTPEHDGPLYIMDIENETLTPIGSATGVRWVGLDFSKTVSSAGFSDREPGSSLVVPLFDVNNNAGNSRTTTLKVSNTNTEKGVWVHFVRVCGGIKSFGGQGLCQASDRTQYLTPGETWVRDVASFFSIDRDNCPTGYIVAYAQKSANDPQPIVHNHLIGSVHMNSAGALNQRTSGMQVYGFEAFGMDGDDVVGSVGGAFPQLPFDNVGYAAPATTYSTDFLATQGTRHSELTLLTLDIQAGAQNDPTFVALDWYNQDEEPFSGGIEYVCHVRVKLSDEINAAQPGAGIQGGNNFIASNMGSQFGLLVMTPFTADHAILGAIMEQGQNRQSLRGLWHDDVVRPTVFIGR